MYILGISAFYHDSAACLLKNGSIIAAAQEERFSRIKHDETFPINAIRYCIKEAKIKTDEIKYVVFYEKPFIKFERILETYLAFAPRGLKSFLFSMPLWIKEKLFQKKILIKKLYEILDPKIEWNERILFSEHHLSHAASAFYPSPFKKSVILTLDGVGEWTTASVAMGNGKKIEILKEIHFPHSLGLLYSAFTYYIGFKVNSGEYKLMGLAPYGKPKYSKLIKEKLIHIAEDGSFRLNMDYFDYSTGLKMTNKRFNSLFGGSPRESESKITQKEMDIAASIQNVTEEIIIKIAKNIYKETKVDNLCLAGGVALNCVANGILHKEKIFKSIWIQPAAGDAGGALGAAMAGWHSFLKKERIVSSQDNMLGSFLGPKFSNVEIKTQLLKCGAKFKKMDDSSLFNFIVEKLIEEKAIGWMQGRMEFGPRALGGRSIIADPRSKKMQKVLNLKVKFRESFRPFAPSVLSEHAAEWFDFDDESPYMLFVSKLKKNKIKKLSKKEDKLFGIEKLNIPRSDIPAVTHVDYSARIQTVNKKENPRYHKLISEFYKKTGCPVLVNTSFNVRGEPIVCSPEDAYNCFMGTNLDYLIIENYVLCKNDQDKELLKNYIQQYDLD
jgi:carbamoyltransferase